MAVWLLLQQDRGLLVLSWVIRVCGIEGSTCYYDMNSPSVLSNYSSNKLYKGASIYKSEPQHERLAFVSTTNSTCSDPSSSSPSATLFVNQGMLQCSWKDGSPHFVFSLDDQKVVYVANLWKVEFIDDKAVNYTYLFYLRMGGQKEQEICDSASHLVGKMKVSTSFTLCPNKSRIMEREFVLFGSNENLVRVQTSSHDLKKNEGLSKKVAEVFRTSQSMKKRTASRFIGSSAKPAAIRSWEPFQDTDNNTDALCGANLLENHLPPNLELVAIVVKDHLPGNLQGKGGGWGLKFLKNVKQTDDLMEFSQPSGCCVQDTGDCSTSMDVLIPAGLHGGPTTRNGGPSSLIERWRSGGCCDCYGWDLGCPLTVLKKRLGNKELSPQPDMQGGCKLVDFIIQGSENSAPPLRMVNVHSGLYFVNFQSMLSALQSFSIAVAFIHAQSPALRPQNVQEFKWQDSGLSFK
ncbi:hypothetical protein MANES_15G045200v8 [Manihot esculenta]|uniref:Uncharacterized protein n=1 Tax=Manihot esculenta TaxID=3983 RepID=A0ACB7G9T4_MANES|nr:hypothetical protein MANES_15G045200v8 [Manihot esculenta]